MISLSSENLSCLENSGIPPVILLLGPTASGKTDLAIEFARRIPSEIISVDSAMVYRGMNVGTGKPSRALLEEIPHHLIDIRDPSEPYSAAEFCQDAITLIQEIRKRNRIPLLVGGTMLYFRSLLQGLSPLPSANPNIRAQLLQEAEEFGWQALHDRLLKLDPKAGLRIHPNDPQRIQRALEIYELTGAASDFKSPEIFNLENNLIFVILPKDRAVLHARIEQRFHLMLEQGLLTEVQTLYRALEAGDLNMNLPALRAVGYRQVLHYLAGDYDYDTMVNRAIAATRQLAKRQITWLRGLFNQQNPVNFENPKHHGNPEHHGNYGNPENSKHPENPRHPENSEHPGNQKNQQSHPIHFLDLQNNHSVSLQSMIHCLT